MSAASYRKIALFGGSFDPPHCGHLAVAEAAQRAHSLDRILLAPVGRQPLKPNGAQASFSDRLHMVDLLCQNQPTLAPSSVDRPRADGQPNYTIDAIRHLRSEFPAAALFVIVGADAFLTLHQWKAPEDLLREAEWIVVSRPAFDIHSLEDLRLTPSQRERVHTLTTVASPVSATEVRRRLHAHEDCTGMVPPPVLDYIRSHHLYGS